MAGFSLGTAMFAASLGLGAAGTYSQMQGSRQQVEAQKRAERLRQSAMEMDARRRMTEALRNQQKARAMALTTTTAQGAAEGSGLGGAYGQIGGQTGNVLAGTLGGLALGRGMFEANQDIFEAQSLSATGAGMSSLGTSLMGSMPAASQLGRNYFPSQSNYDYRMGFPSPWQRG
jgi:hypothetical protein